MKRVPAEELAEHAAEYLAGSEPVSVEKDGEVIGQYVPTPNGHSTNGGTPNAAGSEAERRSNKAQLRTHFAQLRSVLQEIYEDAGMTEGEFADLFDTTKPFPYDLNHKS
jgi:hypothetical protein